MGSSSPREHSPLELEVAAQVVLRHGHQPAQLGIVRRRRGIKRAPDGQRRPEVPGPPLLEGLQSFHTAHSPFAWDPGSP